MLGISEDIVGHPSCWEQYCACGCRYQLRDSGNLTKLMHMQLDHTSVRIGSNLFMDAFCTLQGNKKLHSLASLCMMICTFEEENLNIEMGAIVNKPKGSIIIGRQEITSVCCLKLASLWC
jgi:hypothetical protein